LLYAVAEAGVARHAALVADGAGGPDQPPLRAVCHRRLGAVVGACESEPVGTASELWAYEAVVEGLMRAGAILPARFGTVASGEAEIRGMLAARATELKRGLKRVRGAVEFAVRGPSLFPARLDIRAGTTSIDDRPGTAYLQRRLATEQQARRLADTVKTDGGGLVRETLSHPSRPLAVLVEASGAEAFAARMDARGLVLTGPWPPYSFVAGGA
jgi:hypothetical protein